MQKLRKQTILWILLLLTGLLFLVQTADANSGDPSRVNRAPVNPASFGNGRNLAGFNRNLTGFNGDLLPGNWDFPGNGGGNGGGGIIARTTLDGSLHQIKVDSLRTVVDSAFFDPANAGNLDTGYTVQNQVTLMINEASTLYLKSDSFTVTVQMRISYATGPAPADTASIVRNFTVNYDSAHAYNSRSSFVFTGGHRVTMKVLSVTSSVSSWDPTTVLLIDNQLTAKPNFKLTCSNTVSGITVSPSADPAADELPVSWSTVTGTDQYDLEWTYIDSTALVYTLPSGGYKYGNPANPDPSLIFRNNATRVTVSGTSYQIPLIYDNSGTLFIRVRPTQIKKGYSVTAAIWSSEAAVPVMGQYVFMGHERSFNWQSNISFAEEGKRKVVLQYYDGSLRSRQTVTKDNTTDTTIIAETYYDYQGRPSLQVMPAPTLSNTIKYTAGFNVSINGAEYSQSNYDSLPNQATFCSIHADSMSNLSGSSQYYSPNNPKRMVGMNQFIPDAHDYPFTETEYTPDNTGRISRQGGVGKDHQLGTGHETKYYYGTPDQRALDALFGTEVGDASHYFKNMVRDANGQYSISYVDMHGRTVATALAGAAPSGMAALSTNADSVVTETLADPGTVVFKDLSMISQKSLVVATPDSFQFNYRFNPASFTGQNCQLQNICYTCRYDLEITISSDCANQLLGGQPFDTVIHNFSLDTMTAACSTGPMNLSFSLYLPEGSYVVTKKLTANKDAYNYYRDSVYIPNNTCSNLQQFITQQKTILATANAHCAPDCRSCKDSIGTWDSFWAKYILHGGLSPSDTAAYSAQARSAYQTALSSCAALCADSISDADDIRLAMLQDMTPPFGQYADTSKPGNKYSIFYIPSNDSLHYAPIYARTDVHYLTSYGTPDNIYIQQSDLTVPPNSLSADQFIQNFRSSWAEALLPYHPEYCKLLALEGQNASSIWGRRMQAIDDFQGALNQGYLNPTGNSSYSSYPVVSANIDPLSQEGASYKQQLENILTKYKPVASDNNTTSLWGLAVAMVKCNTTDKACFKNYATAVRPFDTTLLCTGDLDMAWKLFRELYLNGRQDIINNLVNNPTNCTPQNPQLTKVPSSSDLFKDSLHAQFIDKDPQTGIFAQGPLGDMLKAGGNDAEANHQKALMQQSMDSFYMSNAKALAIQWIKDLAPCPYTPAQLDNNILPALIGICYRASDSAHLLGASSLPTGVVLPGTSFNSFQDVLRFYNQSYPTIDTLHCNAEMITAPKPYYSQPIYANKPVYSKPEACECDLIRSLNIQYKISPVKDPTFSAFLYRTQQIIMSDADLTQLLVMCGNKNGNSSSCTWLTKPIYLPPAMQCNSGTVCASCTLVDSIYAKYIAQYPADTPVIGDPDDSVQNQKNRLFQNYMNNRLGYSKQAVDYLQFMDTCRSHAATIQNTQQCLPHMVGNLFQSGGNDLMKDIQVSPAGGYILAGSTTGIGAGGRDAYMVKVNDTGAIQWAKTWGGTGDDNFNRVRATSDNGYIAIGTTKSGQYAQGELLIVKMNASGGTQWKKAIGFGSPYGDVGYDIIQTSDGGYAALGIYNQHAGTGDFLLARLDTGGVVSWVHQFGSSRSGTPGDCSTGLIDSVTYNGTPVFGLLEHDDTLMVTGNAYDTTMRGRYYGVVYKVDKDSGNITGSWHYQDSSDTTKSCWFGDIYPSANGYLLSVTHSPRYGSDSAKAGVLSLSATGAVLSYNRFNPPPGSDAILSSGIYPTPDGGYMAAQTGNRSPHIFWERMDANGSLLWSNKTILPGSQLLGRLVRNQDSSFTAAAINNNHALLLNVSATATTGCYDSVLTMGVTSPSLVKMDWGVQQDRFFTPGNTNVTLTETLVNPGNTSLTCSGSGDCYNVYTGPTLCGKSAPVFADAKQDSITTCSDSTFFSVSKGTELFKSYRDSLTGDFEQRYNNICLQAYKNESFTVRHKDREYHYTLYYYDQAGNLLKTIPPAGVQKITDTTWLKQVVAARATGTVLVPTHTLPTNYRYNTLNQVVAQKSPDGGMSNFWYDRLGRLAISQNARQKPNNQYSYTQYDSIGRIVQVGQLVSATAIADNISRVESALTIWKNNAASTADQITVTSYDTAYPALAYNPSNPTIPGELTPANLRNRVAWTSLYKTASDLAGGNPYAAATTYYSYDILGNVDTLVQDYGNQTYVPNVMNTKGNRFKKLVYDYDLVSGKVNQVAYQHGFNDAFYHSYLYDAENRITNVQTSRDSLNWDTDAWYSYYAHGPLARTILGQQQVQGVNYAYTLQGWLKSINPVPYTGGGFTLRPDSAGNIVAGSAYNLLLNYYRGDYAPISAVAGPDNGINAALGADSANLYNGNITNMGVQVRKLANPLLYNYQYDQLNRLVHMDAWKRNSAAWNDITKVPDFQESIAYDPNGNILKYKRNGNNTFAGQPIGMDSLSYAYTPGTNKLDHIHDSVPPGNYTGTDIDDQAAGNYRYDSIGNLVFDAASNISSITWTVYGKIASITKSDTTISYTYDAGGHRISKAVTHSGETLTTWYVRDASGNVMSVYTDGDAAVSGKQLTQTELHLYGSSRLGILKTNTNVEYLLPVRPDSLIFTRGNKLFELSNHLGNVLATISDKRFGVSADGNNVSYFLPEMVSANDYYPFGSMQPGRSYAQSGSNYRYGFNGKENDNEVKGVGEQQDYGMRVYDPRIGRFLSVDPLTIKYPELTPYQFASNRPIDGIDMDGLEYATFRIYVDAKNKVTKIKTTTDYELKANGSQGPGIQYYVIKPGSPPEGKFVKNMYGIYQGPDNPQLPIEGKDADDYHDNYSLKPIDETDANAKQHDLDYDREQIKGLPGVMDDKSTEANEAYIKRAEKTIAKYEKGGIDEVTKKPVTKEASDAAKKGRNGFKAAEFLKANDKAKREQFEKRLNGIKRKKSENNQTSPKKIMNKSLILIPPLG